MSTLKIESDLMKRQELIDYLETENEQLKADIEILKQNQSNSENNNNHSEKTKKPKFKVATAKPAPRLYCDICDLFDSHDTEDCPQQSMPIEDELSSHSRYNQVSVTTTAGNNRAYCDLCESFGHDEVDCKKALEQKATDTSDEEF